MLLKGFRSKSVGDDAEFRLRGGALEILGGWDRSGTLQTAAMFSPAGLKLCGVTSVGIAAPARCSARICT